MNLFLYSSYKMTSFYLVQEFENLASQSLQKNKIQFWGDEIPKSRNPSI